MSRLALSREVLFVETHCSAVSESTWELHSDRKHPGIEILVMHLPRERWGEGSFIDAERRRLLEDFLSLSGLRYENPVLWFYDPMAVVAFADHCGEVAIVYDCMDELAQFRGAPPELREREAELLRQADVVFCGGQKMRAKRLPHNPNCHFYGTGVDYAHFSTSLSPTLEVDQDISRLPGKVLGYFGVIDERIDYDLLTQLADADPAWSIAMVGPFAKISAAELPHRPNLFWLGRREYAELPAITKGFAVCLMPFALNSATEFINPTKALEYMATGRPVVSTALDEVRMNFSEVCHIAGSREEFVRSCEEQANEPDELRVRHGRDIASTHTWEFIVESMERHLYAAILARGRRGLQPTVHHV
jgi:hypothetical protein